MGFFLMGDLRIPAPHKLFDDLHKVIENFELDWEGITGDYHREICQLLLFSSPAAHAMVGAKIHHQYQKVQLVHHLKPTVNFCQQN